MAVNKRRKKMIMWVCFIAYLLFLSYLLFFSSYFGRTEHGDDEYRYNLTLFQEIGRYYRLGINKDTWSFFVVQVCGNVAVFIPVGMFLPQVFKRCNNVFLTMLISLELSLLAEITQLVARVGSFDVDDLLLNTIGGLCGFIILQLWQMWKKTKNRK